MNLTEHFTLEELTFSSTAVRLGIDNTAPDEFIPALQHLSLGLELIRSILGSLPLHIDSGYRCQKLNKAVGGVPTSAHRTGYAADFVCPSFGTPLEIVKKIEASELKFDQLIVECNAWVHVSFAPSMRQEVLTAVYKDGKASYHPGA